MKQHKLFLAIAASALAISGASAAFVLSANNIRLTNATTPIDYDVTLELTADQISTGSGSVVLNGNTFNYTDITVQGDKMVLNTGSAFDFVGESGASISGDGFVGGSFKRVELMPSAAGTISFMLNNDLKENIPASAGSALAQNINSTKFEFSILDGSVEVSYLRLKYSCVAPSSQRVLLIGEKDAYLNSSNYPAGQSYISLMESLGQTAVVDELFETSARPTYTMAVLAKTSTNFYKALNTMLNENVYDAIVLQVSPRCTPNSAHDGSHANTVEQSEIAAITSLKTRLHQETDNIYVFAIQDADGNPYIWENTDDLKYTKTENQETKTFDEMCAYYSDLSETMATAVEGKAMHFADCYSQYKRSTSLGGLGYSVTYGSLRYMYSHVMYATFFNRAVPSASTYTGTTISGEGAASAKAMTGVRKVVADNCIH